MLPPVGLTRLLVVLLSLPYQELLHAAVAAAMLSRPALSGISQPKAFMYSQRPAALRGRKFSRLRRAETVVEGRAEARRMGPCGVVWGVFGGVDVRCGKKKCDILFFSN